MQREGQSCSNCGYNKDVRCLDFAHYDRTEKLKDTSGCTIDPSKMTLSQLKNEVDKTRFLCKNCHAEETHQESGVNLSQSHEAIRGRRDTQMRRNPVNDEKLRRGQCIDCGLKVQDGNYHLFDFDHNPIYPKLMGISQMIGCHCSIDRIIDEMNKCDLRCKNCHCIKTLERGQHNAYVEGENQCVLDVIAHLIK